MTIPGQSQTGVSGALSRFSRRSNALDYIALAFLVAGWILVGCCKVIRVVLFACAVLANVNGTITDPAVCAPLPSHVYP